MGTNKKPTGRVCTPKQFRVLNQCIECGKAGMQDKETKCDDCMKLELNHCEMCTILLRNGTYKFYTYDIKDDKRSDDVQFILSKNGVREFTYEKTYCENVEGLCHKCVDWKTKIKNICWGTHTTFKNTKENYKLNGNMRPEYAELFQEYGY